MHHELADGVRECANAVDPMFWLLGLILLLFVRYFSQKTKDTHSKINLEDLFLDEHKELSRRGVAFMAALVLGVWMIVWLTQHGQMTEGYFAIFLGAFVAPVALSIWKGEAQPVAVESSAVTTTTSTISKKESKKPVDEGE